MSADPFAMYDAAYVLGALSPQDRAAFEEHMRGCDTCARAVGELAGLPGLLGLLSQGSSGEEGPAPRPEPPAVVLPALLARVAGERRRRRALAALSAGAVALAACVALVFTLTGASGAGGESESGESEGTESEGATAMTPLGHWPVTASVELIPAGSGGGTRVEMECSYTGGREGDYVLVAISGDGAIDELARWHALPQDTARLAVSTSLPRADIVTLEIRIPSGLPVLRTDLR
ncbi:zf-HC2 domain-containing protein [Streptomyces specialis]|uniref:zf-HC2 domain-containing protein n=1 Tax=Streptomyces specialis TaxID=498367 RepID=UPI00073E9C63|nr:zf-HC2 domain-containing protein [Streptomyces specialis]